MKNLHVYVVVLLVALSSFSCTSKKEDPSTTSGAGPTAPVSLHLHTYIGDMEVDGPFLYQDAEGRKIKLDTAQVYLSNIELVKFDGSIYQVKDVIVLVKPDIQVYSIGEVPVGNYKSIRFQAGLTADVNAKIPSGNNVLNDKSMLFGGLAQADNHVFMFCSGKIDTTAAKNATDDKLVDFKYKIGTNNQLKNVVMPVQNYAVSPNNTTYVHMYADYSKLFSGVNLVDDTNLEVNSIANNSSANAIKIANNIPSMFVYENE